jgi:murein DD-endopeptidase MepM/ murein hydrolase activator NlpD
VASIKYIQAYGDSLMCMFDDGSRVLALPTGQNVWLISGSGSSGGGFPTPGNKLVVYPTENHNVSDSFAVHVQRGSPNPGTDYTAAYGSQVVSVAAGVVTDADPSTDGGGGRTVHVDHTDGSGADYLHLSTIECAVGQNVAQGEKIAHSGASGFGEEYGYGAHLHISYRNNHSHGYGNVGNIDFDALIKSLP